MEMAAISAAAAIAVVAVGHYWRWVKEIDRRAEIESARAVERLGRLLNSLDPPDVERWEIRDGHATFLG